MYVKMCVTYTTFISLSLCINTHTYSYCLRPAIVMTLKRTARNEKVSSHLWIAILDVVEIHSLEVFSE